jgi:phosphoglycerol transferase MdoB-like AlkP superfamily enzyme
VRRSNTDADACTAIVRAVQLTRCERVVIVGQVLIEVVVDFIIIAWLTVEARQPIMAISHRTFRGFTVVMMVFVFWAAMMTSDLIYPQVIGVARDHSSTFIFYSEARFTNSTALKEC